MLNTVVLLGVGYLVYCIYWELTTGARRRQIIREKGCEPVNKVPQTPGTFGYAFFKQNMAALKAKRALQTTKERLDRWGNTFSFTVMGRTAYITIEPENLKTIQSLDFKKWGLPYTRGELMAPFLGVGIFTSNGSDWQHSRDMLRPNFARNQVADLDTFETHISHLVNAVPKDGTTFDLEPLFFNLTMDSATEFLFGESTNTLVPGHTNPKAIKFAECFNRAQEAVAKWSRAGFLAKLVTFDKKYHADAKYCQEFIDEFVTRGLEMKRTGELAKLLESKRYVFLHHLVNRLDDPVRIRSELLNILLAGRDTTASLLSNVWWTLAHRPDVFAKLKAEVDTLGAERPTFELIKDMKYLKAVLNESLRVHPLVPQNARQAFEDTTLPLGGGPDGSKPLFMPKGSVMIWSVYAMHRRKDIYGDDAEEFKPERWLGDKGLRPGWEYLPFNGGPRICLGQQFALTEASYTTIRLMQAVSKLEPRDGSTEWREWLTLTAAVENCKVGLFA